ncbi:MAG: anti sigma factor C-terminal domain-containing protein [Solibacillus sp.]
MSDLLDLTKMEKSIKKAKRRSMWKPVVVTIGLLLLFIIVFFFANRTITHQLEQPTADSYWHFSQISGANEFISIKENFPGILGGETHYKTYKLIEGKVVFTGEGGYGYGIGVGRNEWLGRSGRESNSLFGGAYAEEDLHLPKYSVYGHRQMTFFYPFVQYKEQHQDLSLLNEIGEDKYIEIALSFDKGYTPAEAMALIPKGITKTWLWVDDVQEDEQFVFETTHEDETWTRTLIRNENNVYGFPVITPVGDVATNPAEDFISHISSGQKYRTRWQGEFKRLHSTIAGEDGKLSVADLQIYGIVVTGTKESLAVLQNLSFIKASSFGVIVDKY